MGTPTHLHNVDERGSVLVTEAADCQIVARAKTIPADTVTAFPQDSQNNPVNLPSRRRIYVKNNEAAAGNTVYIGGADATTTIGYALAPQEEVVLDITDDIQLYAVTAAAETVDLRTLELS